LFIYLHYSVLIKTFNCCRMPKKFKQVVKGFRDSLFRGSSLSASKKEQLYRSLHPELQGQPLGFQRGDVRIIVLLLLIRVRL
jgi:hypothetical protein